MSDAHESTTNFLEHHSLMTSSLDDIFKKLALESDLENDDEKKNMREEDLKMIYIVEVIFKLRLA